MKTTYSFLVAIGMLVLLAPTTGLAQETGTEADKPTVTPPTALDWRLSVDSLAAERAAKVPSAAIRSDWTKTDVLLGARRGAPTETVRLTKSDRARYPVANYALRAVAQQACVQRVPNIETARCFGRRVNGTPVTRYPGIITDEPLVHPDPFVRRPGQLTP